MIASKTLARQKSLDKTFNVDLGRLHKMFVTTRKELAPDCDS